MKSNTWENNNNNKICTCKSLHSPSLNCSEHHSSRCCFRWSCEKQMWWAKNIAALPCTHNAKTPGTHWMCVFSISPAVRQHTRQLLCQTAAAAAGLFLLLQGLDSPFCANCSMLRCGVEAAKATTALLFCIVGPRMAAGLMHLRCTALTRRGGSTSID